MLKSMTFKLTVEQRQLLDETVMDCIKVEPKGITASSISVRVERAIAHALPPRPDSFYRYVDQSLQRQRKAGRITWQRDTGGGVVWKTQDVI
jgi:hypothetical protein